MPKGRRKSVENDYALPNIEKGASKPFFSIRKIIAIGVIVLVIIIVLVLALNLLGQKNNLLFFGSDGKPLASKITISKNGALIDSFSTDGNSVLIEGNPLDPAKITINTSGINFAGKNVSIQISDSSGKISIIHLSSNDFVIDENGAIHLTINPFSDLNIGGYFDESTGEFIYTDTNLSASFDFIIEDPINKDTIIVELQGEFIFREFSQRGCVALSRSRFTDSIHYGYLDTSLKVKLSCDSPNDLVSSVKWTSQRMGNVEVVFGNFKSDTVLFSLDQSVISSPTQNTFDARIIFTPFKEFAGKKASFSVSFGVGETISSTAVVDYDVAIDNLEQCVKITPDKVVIPANQNSALLNIDVSSCASSSINFSLCEDDDSCAGGSEGGIDLSDRAFSLSPKGNSSINVSISRQDIPGAYGISIIGRPYGYGKSILDDKLVIVSPTGNELLSPDKFVLSLMAGGKDSLVVHNKSLAEDVEVVSSICNTYYSSLGTKSSGNNYGMGFITPSVTNSWWRDLYSNNEKFAGTGFYSSALSNTLPKLDYLRATIQYISANKNADIKKAYLNTVAIQDPMNAAVASVDKSVKEAQLLKDKVDKANEMALSNLTSQVVSLVTSLASLSATILISCSKATTDITTFDATLFGCEFCPSGQAALAPGAAGATKIEAACASTTATIAEAVTLMNSIYSIYNTTNALATEKLQINADAALKSSKAAQTKLNSAKEKTSKAYANVSFALKAAAIDSFSSASDADAKASEYLTKANQEMTDANQLINDALADQLNANNAITLA
ncbi:MAG: hypothetical protein WCI04_06440, partial [archaeon]